MSDNNISISGNLTRDPELRFTATGRAVCNIGVAVANRFQQDGEWKESTDFFNVVIWGQLGENVAGSLAKGNRVAVTGRMSYRTYETEHGDKRSVMEVIASDVAVSLRFAIVRDIEKVVGRNAGTTATRPEPADEASDELSVA
jgi:single-strand DNA-binding protein